MRRNTLIVILCFAAWTSQLFAQAGDDARQAYVDRYSALAVLEMERTGVPASIKLGQAVLESRWGTSTLAREANNHFGIKCGGRWSGGTYYRKDDDYVLGKLVPSCFRAYKSAHESFVAHSNFLISNSRYAGLFALKTNNYKGWAKGLKKAGYATAKDYHKSLIKVIEDLQLYRYDKMESNDPGLYVGAEPPINPPGELGRPGQQVPITNPQAPSKERETIESLQVLSNNDVKFVVPLRGSTLETLAKELKIPVKWLLAYNENITEITEELDPGVWVYLQAKRKNYRGRQRWHEVSMEDSMFGISQRYGISLTHLYDRNQMIPGSEPALGAKVKIRGGKVKSSPALRAIKGMGVQDNTVPNSNPPVTNNTTPSTSQPAGRVNLSTFIQEQKPPKQNNSQVSSGAIYHKVVIGESLVKIASKYRVSVQQLRDWNGLGENEEPQVGIRLRVQ